MTDQHQDGNHSHAIIDGEQSRKLKKIFDGLPQTVDVYFFTDSSKNAVLNKVGREILTAVSKISTKIKLHEHPLGHELATQWQITRAPALVFSPGRYKVRWLGVPLGEEGRTFVEAIYLMGSGQAGLGKESAKILDRIETPREVKIFVSPTCPYCPQQAVNGLKAAIGAPDKISLEIIDIQANPDLADEYEAHSVPQAFANGKRIGLGAQPEELFMLSLEKLEQQNVFIPESDATEVATDVVVVGGGPAGLTAGIYLARSGLNAVIVEKGNMGGQVATTPVVENYPGFTQVGGKALVDIMVTHALEYVQIYPGEEVVAISAGEQFVVQTSRRRFTARAVLLATGAGHRKLGVPGEDRLAGRGVSYCSTCDGPIFMHKKVLMVGGGNSALTEALHLHNIGVDVTIAHRRDSFRAQEQLVRNVKNAGIKLLFNVEVLEIHGDKRVKEVVLYNNLSGKTETVKMEGVFVSIGYEPAVDLAGKAGVALTPDGYIKKDERHRTSVPGIYAAGDVEGGFKQIVTAAGSGSEAALSIFEDLVNPYWKSEPAKS